MLCKCRAFSMVCISEIIEDRKHNVLQSIDNQIIVGVTTHHLPMTDLGKSKKVTAVLKLGSTKYWLEVKKNYVYY